jgi:hypothetical protein
LEPWLNQTPVAAATLTTCSKKTAFIKRCKRALKRALAEQLDDAMHAGKLGKVAMAQRMATSRSQLDRV